MAHRWLGLAALATLLLAAAACGAGQTMTGEATAESDPCRTKSMSKEATLMLAPNGMVRHSNEVWHKYRPLFSRQPNLFEAGQGLLRHEGIHPAGTFGIVVHVRERVDQTTLPLEDRIPDCLEGVPVQVIESVSPTRPIPQFGEQIYCREHWEAVRLPKEMEDLMNKDARTLTIEEGERTYRAINEALFRAYEVIHANKDLFSRQPNFFMVGPGSIGGDSGIIGVNVHVTAIIPQWKLSPQDRIPCVIDGVPVEITTSDPREFLGGANIRHRALMAGVGIQAPNLPGQVFPGASDFYGTLTGLARRNSDNTEVLVTCLHNLTGRGLQDQARAGYELYQFDTGEVDDKIGTLVGFVPMSKDSGLRNVADVAICTPIYPGPPEFQNFSEFASYGLHNDNHDLGVVIAGRVEPTAGQPLTSVSARSGVRTDVTVAAVNQQPTIGDYRFTGLVQLDVGETPFESGDSGTPLLVEVETGKYRMCCILIGQVESGETYAFPASVAEDELDISFGKEIDMPRLSTEGFVGQRWIIDDYFKAGETLHAGDVVVVKKRSATSTLPRVFKATSTHEKRVIGIVHTPAGKRVGEQMATTGATTDADEYVPVVVKGIAKTLSGGAIGVGDPVMASGSSTTPTAPAGVTPAPTLGAVATVVDASTHSHSPDSDGMTGADGAHSHTVSGVARGPQGEQGIQGVQGPQGAPGADGQDGEDGAPGMQGPPGAQGEQGEQGPQGERGEQGERGPQGQGVPSYSTSDENRYLRVVLDTAEVTPYVRLAWSDVPRGAQGPQGVPGPKGGKGDPGPRGLTGPKGDKGDRGDRGYTGARGSDGRDGSDGDDGSDGRNGRDGANGARGPTGSQGPRGYTGARGPTGPRGLTGPRGPKGDKGDTGRQGPAGTCSCGGGGGDHE